MTANAAAMMQTSTVSRARCNRQNMEACLSGRMTAPVAAWRGCRLPMIEAKRLKTARHGRWHDYKHVAAELMEAGDRPQEEHGEDANRHRGDGAHHHGCLRSEETRHDARLGVAQGR